MNRLFRSLALAAAAVASAAAVAQPLPADVQVTPITTALSSPVGISNAGDGSNRLFVIQQGGAIRVVRNEALNATPYLTINGSTQCRETVGGPLQTTGFVIGGETGLLGLAFHPQFESNGHFFVSYSGAAGDSIVARFTASDPAADVFPPADAGSCLVILRVDQDFSNHNGGHVLFGPDGYLYFGLGDGGSGNDPCNRGQTLAPSGLNNTGSCASDVTFTDPDGNSTPDRPTTTRALLGKLLRLNVDATTPAGANELCGARLDGSANYAIPTGTGGNPFAGADVQGACDETFAYGLRNPWRFSFDRSNGDLFIGDVGQDQWEEINLFRAASGGVSGENLGWRTCEARHARNSCTNLCGSDTSEVILAYHNVGGCPNPTEVVGRSVTGGFRYRGPDPLLQGVYFFSDYNPNAGDFFYWSVDSGGNSWTPPSNTFRKSSLTAGGITAFGEDENGVLYMVGADFGGGGGLSRIGALQVLPPDPLFSDGFESP